MKCMRTRLRNWLLRPSQRQVVLTKKRKNDPGATAFVYASNQHPGIESAVDALHQRGLKRVLSYGSDGFARKIGAVAITANLMRMGSVLIKKQVKADLERQLALRFAP